MGSDLVAMLPSSGLVAFSFVDLFEGLTGHPLLNTDYTLLTTHIQVSLWQVTE